MSGRDSSHPKTEQRLREAESTMSPARDVPCEHCAGTGKVTLPPETETVEAYFFGCWNQAGHYWEALQYDGVSGSYEIDARVPLPLRFGRIDGGYCPGASNDKRDVYRRERPEVEGEARLTHVGGWTVLGWWDRSVDKRGACNSNLVVKGTYDFTQMMAIARARIPHVVARQRQPIRLVEIGTVEDADGRPPFVRRGGIHV